MKKIVIVGMNLVRFELSIAIICLNELWLGPSTAIDKQKRIEKSPVGRADGVSEK